MPLAILRMILPLLLGTLGSTGIRAGLGRLAGSKIAPKALSGLAGRLTDPKAGFLTRGLVDIPGFAGGFAASEAILSPAEQSSDSAQFQQLVNQLGAPPPVSDNQRNLLTLLQREQQRGGLEPLLEELGISNNAVV